MSERQTTGEFMNYRIGERSGKTYNKMQEMAKEIVRLEKENENYKHLILDVKERLNNIQFEVEQTWRKIEKLEDKDE